MSTVLSARQAWSAEQITRSETGGAGLGSAAHRVRSAASGRASTPCEPPDERGKRLVGGDGDHVAAIPVGARVGLLARRREPHRAQHAQPQRLDRAADELAEGRGHASATWACTRSESTVTRCPSTTVSSSPTENVMAVWSRSHGTDSPWATGATAAA